jgi:hypothetical protein
MCPAGKSPIVGDTRRDAGVARDRGGIMIAPTARHISRRTGRRARIRRTVLAAVHTVLTFAALLISLLSGPRAGGMPEPRPAPAPRQTR